MKTWQKLIFVSVGAALVVLVAPVAWSAFGTHGIFVAVVVLVAMMCSCGFSATATSSIHPVTACQSIGPSQFAPVGDEWEVMGLPLSDLYSSPLEGQGRVVARIRFRDGALYESWGGTTNWTYLPKVHNIWRVWWEKLLKQ
jgi:hypothetical protein